jgi:hypothetical protein
MFLLESPWPILSAGIAAEALLAILLLRTGQGRILWAMLGAALLIAAGLVVEWFVVTEREAVEQRLDQAAAAVAANDLEALLACISTTAPKTQRDARWVLGLVEFSKARLSDMEISINRLTSLPTAKAKFLAIGTARDRKSGDFNGTFVRTVTATLRKENGRWMIGEYTVEDLLAPN